MRSCGKQRSMLYVVSTVAVVALGGCGFVGGSASGSPAVRPARALQEKAAAYGLLAGDPNTGCLWIETPSRREQIILYGDFEVQFTDGQPVVRQDGTVVARGGEQVELAGGGSDDAGVDGCPVKGGRLFLVDEVGPFKSGR